MDSEILVGSIVLYYEDGGCLECEVLAYERTDKTESAQLRVISVVRRPFIGDAEVGDIFAPWHRLDAGVWGGDWYLERRP